MTVPGMLPSVYIVLTLPVSISQQSSTCISASTHAWCIVSLKYNITFPIAPDAPPEDVEYANVTSSLFWLSWQPPPPENHNGVIRLYLVLVREEETGSIISIETAQMEVIVASLHPHYHYSCSISAVTVSAGPYSSAFTVQTMEDGN